MRMRVASRLWCASLNVVSVIWIGFIGNTSSYFTVCHNSSGNADDYVDRVALFLIEEVGQALFNISGTEATIPENVILHNPSVEGNGRLDPPDDIFLKAAVHPAHCFMPGASPYNEFRQQRIVVRRHPVPPVYMGRQDGHQSRRVNNIASPCP